MNTAIRDFLISTAVCVLGTVAFWHISGNSDDLRYLSDYFFLSGVAFFILGMIMALYATSRWHYYRHLKKKWQEKENEIDFDDGEKRRRKLMWRGIAVVLSGFVGLAIGLHIAIEIGYL